MSHQSQTVKYQAYHHLHLLVHFILLFPGEVVWIFLNNNEQET